MLSVHFFPSYFFLISFLLNPELTTFMLIMLTSLSVIRDSWGAACLCALQSSSYTCAPLYPAFYVCMLGIQIQFAGLKVMADLSVSVMVMFRYGGSHGCCWAMLVVVEAIDTG